MYGKECNPVDILKKSRKNQKEWQQVEGNMPGPSRRSPTPPVPEPAPPIMERHPSPQSETGGDFDDLFAKMWPDSDLVDAGTGGGVPSLQFLLAKAILPSASTATDPKTWAYKDIACLPQLEQQEWQSACL